MSIKIGVDDGSCSVCNTHTSLLEVSISRFHDVESVGVCFDCIRSLIWDYASNRETKLDQ